MKKLHFFGLCALSLTLTSCGGDDDDMGSMMSPPPADQDPFVYSVEVTNLTHGQPFSPLGVIVHNELFELMEVGEPVSQPLEVLAEGGDNSELLAFTSELDSVHTTASGEVPVPPGMSQTMILEVRADTTEPTGLYLNIVTMLVNTNDAITTINPQLLDGMTVNDNRIFYAATYDSGTEGNSENADDIPGPAAAGGLQEGYNEMRDDIVDELRAHSGVVTLDDGLSSSNLSQAHRWDNPVMRVKVTRMQ